MNFYARHGLKQRETWPGTASAAENHRVYRWELGFWAAICGLAALVIAAELIGFLP